MGLIVEDIWGYNDFVFQYIRLLTSFEKCLHLFEEKKTLFNIWQCIHHPHMWFLPISFAVCWISFHRWQMMTNRSCFLLIEDTLHWRTFPLAFPRGSLSKRVYKLCDRRQDKGLWSCFFIVLGQTFSYTISQKQFV